MLAVNVLAFQVSPKSTENPMYTYQLLNWIDMDNIEWDDLSSNPHAEELFMDDNHYDIDL